MNVQSIIASNMALTLKTLTQPTLPNIVQIADGTLS